MWFKNLQLYRLPAPWPIDLAALETQLARGAFAPCPASQPASRGWTSPRGDGALVYALNRQWLLTLTTEQRLLPASVILQEVRERAEKLAEERGFGPGRKELRDLREQVTQELLPRAFTRQQQHRLWLDPQNGWCLIDVGSSSRADEVIEQLRLTLDEFPLTPVHTELSPATAMADWLAAGEAPAGFTIDRDCELKSLDDEKSAVRYVRHPLDGDELRAHLGAGKLPTRLALTWDERLSFVLTDKLEIRRLSFLDLIKEEAEKNATHADEQFDADFALMTGELARFLPQLMAALGGESAAV